MDITLYKVKDEKDVINKTKSDLKILWGTLKDSTTILTPSIRVKRNDELLEKNYMYIPKFKRYYFITDIVVDGPHFIISGEVDVLESYKTEILASKQVISRQEKKFNLQLVDDKITRYGKTFQVVKKIGTSPFDTDFLDRMNRPFTSNERYNFVLTVTNDE